MEQVTILGAGMAGFGAAYQCDGAGVKSVIFEKQAYHGGHAASFKNAFGFIFDDGPHISFTKEEGIQKLFAESVNHDYQTLQTQVNNFWKGQYWIKHPAQCNLFGLPVDLVVEIVKDFIHAKNATHGEFKNYADWLIAAYGKTFAETFPMKYGDKYHTTTADNMSTDWLGPRFYQPELEEVLRGTLTPHTPDVHYVSHFRYPSHNGFVSYLDQFLNKTDIRVCHELIRLNPKARTLHFSNGTELPYSHIISSLPLPELIARMVGVPDDVLEATRKLACTTCVLVNVGINRENISNAHWSYFYDDDIVFTRVSFPHMFSPYNVPPGMGSIQVEVYYSQKYRPFNGKPEDCILPVLRDLRRCGLLTPDDEIVFAEASLVPYANIIFDLDRSRALPVVHGYLDELKIACCGRYGEWGYHWTDESFISGQNAAQTVIDSMTSSPISAA